MPQSTEEFKNKFNDKLTKILEQKGTSSKKLSKEKYKWIINRLGDLALQPAQKKTSPKLSLAK